MNTPAEKLQALGNRAEELASEIATLASEANDLVKEAVCYRTNEAAVELLVFSNRVKRGTYTLKDKNGERDL